MARSELIAEVSFACFFMFPMVGIAMSMRMRMMEMTISSSISVKPFCRVESDARRLPLQGGNLRFMGFQCLVERPQSPGPSVEMLQRTDAEGKWDARKGSCQLSVEVFRLAPSMLSTGGYGQNTLSGKLCLGGYIK